MNDTKVFESFERPMLGRSLAAEVEGCARQELAPFVVETLKDFQPVLEGGCGPGQWFGQNAKKQRSAADIFPASWIAL